MKKKPSLLWRMTKGTAKGVGKLAIVYPAKGIWFLTKKSYQGIKSANAKRKEQKQKTILLKQKPQAKPAYDSLQEIKRLRGDYTSFEQKLLNNKSTIGLILGARGTGKSAIGMRLLENFASKTGKKLYALGFRPESLPHWITVINDVSEIENNAALLIDEGGIEFSSRSGMSNANKLLSEILLIARHKDLSVMFITQNSANLEINAIRQADYLVLKPSSLLQKEFERPKIKEIYAEVEKDFEKLKTTDGLTYVYADNYKGFVTNSLPSFWSEGVSKGYAQRR